MPRDVNRQVHGPEAFAAALRTLSSGEIRRLDLMAAAIGRSAGLDSEDIRQVAFEAVLDGRRPWPTDVGLIPFLVGVMRSVANAACQRRARAPSRHPLSLEEIGAEFGGLPDNQPDVLRSMIAREDWKRISDDLFQRCEGDDAASSILLGLLDDLDGQPLREATGLDQTAYNSKRRWVRRQIDACLARELDDE